MWQAFAAQAWDAPGAGEPAWRFRAPEGGVRPYIARERRFLVKAVVYHGPRNVSVDEVPDAKIGKPTDALVRITATNICGSDLHMYEGRTDFEDGRVFGHRERRGSHRGRGCGRQDQSRRHDLGSVQRRLRALPQLRGRADQLLPARQRARDRRRRLRVRRHGPMAGRPGRVAPRAVGRLQLPAATRGRHREAGRLRDALGYLPHRLALGADVRLAPGESIVIYGGGPVGCMAALSAATMGAPDHGRGPSSGPAPARRADRRDRCR